MNKTKRLNVRLSASEHKLIKDFCTANDLVISEFCRNALLEQMSIISRQACDTPIVLLCTKAAVNEGADELTIEDDVNTPMIPTEILKRALSSRTSDNDDIEPNIL